jgi:adenylate kinase
MPSPYRPAMRILLSGPPSCGKTTQGRRLAELLGVPHVSSGDLIRKAAESGRASDVALARLVSDGSLAPSGAICCMVQRRLFQPDCADGFVLDGFPRKREEAHFLTRLFAVDALIVLEASPSVLLDRVRRRFHEGRADDNPNHFPRRIAAFEEDTRAAHDELGRQDVPIFAVEADGVQTETAAAIEAVVERLRARATFRMV